MKHVVLGLMLIVLCVGLLTITINIQPGRAVGTIVVPDDYSTIQAAVNAAGPHYTIIVRDGRYSENVTVNKNDLVIMGQYRRTAVVHGSFYLSNVSYVTIANFTILGFGSDPLAPEQVYGIVFQQSSFNTIRNNNISNWYDGMYFNYLNYSINPPHDPTTCHNNTILENDIGDCHEAIFFMEGLTYNRFYHNNFYNTLVDYVIPDVEFWDNGYPSGGNYWSGCTMVDSNWGPNQDQPGNDGINDTQYMVYPVYPEFGGIPGYDHYPLTSPWSPPDIAVMGVTPSKTVVGEGTMVYINTTLLNNGTKVEMFNVTVYANTSVIYTFPNVIFLVGSGSGIGSWDTTGFAYGNYTLSAYAWPVPGETDTANNNYTCNVPLHIGVPGDVSSTTPGAYDGVDNMKDIAYLVSLFNTRPSSPNWNPNADVNNDGVCNMKDIAIAVLHFNQHE